MVRRRNELIERTDWITQGRYQIGAAAIDVEAVDAVECGEGVFGTEKQWLPSLVGRLRTPGRDCFDHHDDGSKDVPVGRRQDLTLGSFDVDLEKVDRSSSSMLTKNGVEASLRNGDLLHAFDPLRDEGVRCRVDGRHPKVRIRQEKVG